jgi:hypothetical protein
MSEGPRSTDGGEPAAPVDVQRAGDSPPAPPSTDGLERTLPDLLDGTDSVTTAYVVRAALIEGSDRGVGERLVDAIEDQVTVLGTTLDAGLEPSNPQLDVLIETDHDHGAVASSLATVGPVDGVAVADVTAAAERELGAESEAEAAGADDAASANDVFNELKEEVGQEGYGDVVDELEDVSFPGGPDPDEEVDLEAETGIDLEGEEPEPIDLEGEGADEPPALDLEEDDDELTAKQLLGEEERDGEAAVKAPDEKAIEEAIEEVELEDDGAGQGDLAGDVAGTEPPAEESVDVPEPDEMEDPEPDEMEDPEQDEMEDPEQDEMEDPERPAEEADGETSGAVATPPSDAGDMDAFVAQLTAALEAGAVDDERLTDLREALGVESTHSLDVRLEYLQKRVDNLGAYTDAWEEFLSEQGSGREFLDSVRDDVETIEARLDALEEGGAAGDLSAVEDRLAEVESALQSVEQRHDDDVARLDTRMDNVESKLEKRIDAIEGALGTIKDKLMSLLEWREHIDQTLGDR